MTYPKQQKRMIYDHIRTQAEAALTDAEDAEPRWAPLPWCPEQFPNARMKTREETDRWTAAVQRKHANADTREPALAEFALAVIAAINQIAALHMNFSVSQLIEEIDRNLEKSK